MASRKKARSTRRKPAIALSLEKSAKVVDRAIAQDKKLRLGGIGAALAALREFCRYWPTVKPVVKRIIEFLKTNGQHQAAKTLESFVTFLDALHRLCPLIP